MKVSAPNCNEQQRARTLPNVNQACQTHLFLGLAEVHLRDTHAPFAQRQQARLSARRLDVSAAQLILETTQVYRHGQDGKNMSL